MLTKVLFLLLILQCLESKNSNHEETLENYYFDKYHTVKLKGNITFGYFYADIYVGTPPQIQSVIIDTDGTSNISFPCDDCQYCGKHNHLYFDNFISITSKNLTSENILPQEKNNCKSTDFDGNCLFSESFAEGSSMKGFMIKDKVLFDQSVNKYAKNYSEIDMDFVKYFNHESVELPIGCITKETKQIYSQHADGILGLANPSAFINLDNFHEKNMFSLCFNRTNGGFMTIGGYDTSLQVQTEYTHTIPFKGKYEVELKSIDIDGRLNVSVKNKKNYSYYKTTINSGTTIMYAPLRVIRDMESSVKNFCDFNKTNCGGYNIKKIGQQTCFQRDQKKYPTEESFFSTFPPIIFNFDGFPFSWQPENYLFIDGQYNFYEKNSLYCYAFEPNYFNSILLGASWMQQFDILFDMENNKLLFTKSDCSPERVQEKPIVQEEIEYTANDEDTQNQIQANMRIIEERIYNKTNKNETKYTFADEGLPAIKREKENDDEEEETAYYVEDGEEYLERDQDEVYDDYSELSSQEFSEQENLEEIEDSLKYLTKKLKNEAKHFFKKHVPKEFGGGKI